MIYDMIMTSSLSIMVKKNFTVDVVVDDVNDDDDDGGGSGGVNDNDRGGSD